MKRKMAGLFIALSIVTAIALVVRHRGSLPNDEARNAAALPRQDLFKTDTPQRQDFMETCRWFGKVESRDKTQIVALQPGRIVSVSAKDGMPVTEGALLFTIGGRVNLFFSLSH
ncbi:MAG: hypothetical protein HZA01_08355 [Nitrospinae bacterium]|nr:hypothetical protein [Nitrospinota bacterium]